MKKAFTLSALTLLVSTLTASATDYYISPSGADINDGLTQATALATLTAAQTKAAAGDNVYILPGTYQPTLDDCVETGEGRAAYTVVYKFTKSGQLGKPIRYVGVADNEGQRPVFDFSQVQPQSRVTAFLVSANYLVFRNLEVIGTQMVLTTTENTQSENFRVTDGNWCTFDNVSCHDTQGIGFYLTRRSSNNLFLNCDGYNNYDPNSQNGRGGNCDGFGCHVMNAEQTGNTFIGCRAWNNSDDGFDLINCYAVVEFAYSYAFKNGYDASNTLRGDGNGFKAGGFGMSASDINLGTAGAPRHLIHHCVASTNKSNGFYSNHHLGGLDFYSNTAINNGRGSACNYSLVNRKGAAASENTDVNGYGHNIHHNLSYSNNNKHVTALDGGDGQNTISDNSFTWDGSAWTNTDIDYSSFFESTNTDRIMRARKSDGTLSSATLTYGAQNVYAGYGSDFSGYEDAVMTAKKTVGAETLDFEIDDDFYVSGSTVWDFEDLTAGTVFTSFVDYNGMVLRASTANNHGITVNDGGGLSFQGNGAAIATYLGKDRKAASDPATTSYDRALAFNAQVAGTTTVVFTASSNKDDRFFQVYFKAKGKEVVKAEQPVAKAETTVSLTSDEEGVWFIAATSACTVHNVTFVMAGDTTDMQGIDNIGNLIDSQAPAYNLRGQRVGTGYRGLVIKGGKKVVMK